MNWVSESRGEVGGGLIARAAIAFYSQKISHRRVHGSKTHPGTGRQQFAFQARFDKAHPQLRVTADIKPILG